MFRLARLAHIAVALCTSSLMATGLGLGLDQKVYCNTTESNDKEAAAKLIAGAELEKYALLIGINDYIHNDYISDLSGCENDVDDMKKLLMSKYGFVEKNIKILKSRQATKSAIIETFKSHLIENAKKASKSGNKKNPVFLLHYAGHGSYTKDDNNEEGDGYDETIVPVDASESVTDIRDDQIEELINQLTDYTQNATLVFDSCHSGTISREGTIKPRFVASQDSRYTKANQTRGGDGTASTVWTEQVFLPKNERYVTISGCSATQTSGEDSTKSPDGNAYKTNGIMSRSLIDVLTSAPPDISYKETWEKVCNAIEAKHYSQSPQIEGDWERIVFGGSNQRSTPYFRINKVEGDTITVNLGLIHGLKSDSLLALYSQDKTTLKGADGLIGQAKVLDVGDFDCKAKVAETTAKALEKYKGIKVVAVTPTFGTSHLKVSIDDMSATRSKSLNEAFSSFTKTLLQSFSKDSQIEIALAKAGPTRRATQMGPQPDLRICSCAFKDLSLPTAIRTKSPIAGDDIVYFVTDKTGVPLYNFFAAASDSTAAEQVTELINKKLQQDAVRSIDNAISNLGSQIAIELVRVIEETIDGKKVQKEKVLASDQRGVPSLKVGEKFRLKLTNKGDKDLYPALLSLGTSGIIHQLYPPKGSHNDVIHAGNTAATPVITVGLPLGVETLKLMITTQPVDFSYLNQSSVTRMRGIATEKLDKSLSSLIKRSLGIGSTLRDTTTEECPEPDQWAALRRDFVIAPADKSNAAASQE